MKQTKKNPSSNKYPDSVRKMRIWHRRLREPLFTLLLTIQVFILFIMPSLRSAGLEISHMAVHVVLLIFIAVAIILSRSRSAIVMMMVSVILTALGIVMQDQHADLLTDTTITVGQVLTQFSLLWVVSSAVFGPGRTTHHRILGAVVMYLGVGMIFTSLDILLVHVMPAAFTHLPTDSFDLRETLTYFSFSTLTTGSFGDILPVHPVARSLANIESITGQLFPATLIARIVGMHSFKKASDGKKG